jgi:hypothetical protein
MLNGIFIFRRVVLRNGLLVGMIARQLERINGEV